jgi:hypothetical protein
MQCGLRFRGIEARAPTRVGKVDRLGQKRLLVERNVEFELGAARQTGFGEQQVPAARPAANREILFALMASAAISSLSGGKRGSLRSGASIMCPENNRTWRGTTSA